MWLCIVQMGKGMINLIIAFGGEISEIVKNKKEIANICWGDGMEPGHGMKAHKKTTETYIQDVHQNPIEGLVPKKKKKT